MKTLIISNLFPNTMEPSRAMFNKQQFTELSKLCELKIVAPLPFFKYSLAYVPEKELIDGIEVHHPRYLVIPKILRSLYGFFFFIGVIKKVKEIYKTFKFDVIFCSWAYPDGFGSALIAKLLRTPFVMKVHGTDVNVVTRYFFRRRMIVYALKRAEKVIAVSNALKEKIIGLGIDKEKIEVISNGVDTDLFRPVDRIPSRDKLCLPQDKKSILYIGNLEKIKGIDLLIDAMKDLPEGINLAIVGRGSLEDELRAKVETLGLEDRVKFYGSQLHSDIPLWLNSCDVLCVPSRNEGCPNVVLEALACGTAIVASKVGGIPELIRTEDAGILVRPGYVSELENGIEAAFEKKWDRNGLRQNVLNYGWTKNAKKLFEELSLVKRMRNILYHHRTQGTGAEGVHVANIIKGFRRLGNKVYVVSPSGVDAEKTQGGNPYGKKKGIGRFFSFLSKFLPQFLFEILEIGYNFRVYFKLKKVLRHKRIDFIYERYAFFTFVGVWLAKKFNIPIILEANEVSGEERVRGQFFVGLARRIQKYVFLNADAIIVVSEFLKERIKQHGVDVNKVFVIPNAVDEDIFIPRYVQKNGEVLIGFIGWFVKWHNIESLIDAFSNVSKKVRSCLFLIGDGVLKDSLKSKVKSLDLEEKVVFTGAIPYERIPDYIDIMDICVVPGSNEYRSPIKLFEYMAMGKAVVAPKYKPIESIIEDDKDGVLFEPGDSRSLEERLEILVKDASKRKLLGEKAREKVLKEHTWLGNARRVMEIYDNKRSSL
ncbi:glycosyltransferase [bacterium]|nr:glycosyltransferase [bacterium]